MAIASIYRIFARSICLAHGELPDEDPLILLKSGLAAF
jgi:hypothetical protein